MAIVNQSTLVAYNAQQMYRFVNDYERYPEFLPGCVDNRTLNKSAVQLTGESEISKAGIRQKFTTCNTMKENQSIRMQFVDGPFKFLQGEKFTDPDEKSCQIQLYLASEFSNPPVGFAFGQIFTHLTNKMIDTLKQRAKQIYG
ncbi:ubiquinone-binding protein [Aggregatibacter actinomycetemcomitans]|uniref:type II toxin-antitoxin system RatA family toxin n=1 Tax=Aggregatibacter actinomycetemcomitans TaxID=714 RepID=UPI00059B19FA|nr:ubiquinone-binding protein [Aggregatibacter actinomycetemcomitans]AFI87757.2 lipid transporter [Aggregatibacter actinomycetemcomitans D7S-1]QEH46073.1 ubiquinone-binding protein [Aggregatibacter actinomycetemcomitans]QEH48104.1 ubiquinone-binding protein [Aggregatibacter actinomycetemcomitans]QEH50101.1 ubiquinone-binding protein [Aggregatibacter actinomycetemcomitans]TYA50002.1 ubiquinone-binding protein [Aggregatibacter actinomycetemcomitans]